MANQPFGTQPDPRRQNILPAVSDDLYARIQALQGLYRIDDEPSSVEQVLDRCVTALMDNIKKGIF